MLDYSNIKPIFNAGNSSTNHALNHLFEILFLKKVKLYRPLLKRVLCVSYIIYNMLRRVIRYHGKMLNWFYVHILLCLNLIKLLMIILS